MSRPWFPPEIYLEIASHSSKSTLAQLLRSASALSVLAPLLYTDISVRNRVYGLVKTLASRADLASLVKSLKFRDSLCAHIDEAQWAIALPSLRNLRHLEITHHVPLNAQVVPRTTFRLHSFTSTCAVFGAWLEFVSQQPELRELAFHLDLLGPVPDTSLLPMLRRVTARPADIARFTEFRLTHMWLWLFPPYGQCRLYTREVMRLSKSSIRLVVLRVNAEQFLVLLSWARWNTSCWKKMQAGLISTRSSLATVALVLDTRMPHLETLTLTSAQLVSEILAQAPMSLLACSGCGTVPAEYHCGECVSMQCGPCITAGHAAATNHAEYPLHQIKRWTGTYYEHASLQALGVILQVGHGAGGHCASPLPPEDWRIISPRGLERVSLHFCHCNPAAKTRRKQLLDAHLASARAIGPRVALTFGMVQAGLAE
ncbi:hypothetical protein C8R44DRAFT_880037 [Mycena epipterygia]|nr:hypothetical protein C8R44DRAFT_880037 [Mycena epipterygia]